MRPLRRTFSTALAVACAAAALPSLAQAQRCRVADIEVQPLSVRVGARGALFVIYRDANGLPCNEDPPHSVTSSNSAIARVDHDEIVGVAAGSVTVTVRSGTGRTAKSGQATVTVLSPETVVPQAAGGQPAAPPAQPQPQPAPVAPVPTNVRGPGAVTIQYQRVGNAVPAGILTDPDRMMLLPGERRFLRYQTVDVTGANAVPLPLLFRVEPATASQYFTVDSIGWVTAADTGHGTIRVSAAGQPNVREAIVAVDVRRDSVRFARPLVSMPPGETDTIRLHVAAQNRDIDFSQGLYRFNSSDTNVVRVHLLEAVLEARAPGTAIITAFNPLLPPVLCVVSVFRRVVAIEAPETTLTIAVRQSRPVTLRPLAADTSLVREAPVTFRGLDTTRAQIRYDSATGRLTVTGRASGTTSVTMRVQNGRDSASAVSRTVHLRVVAGGLQLSRALAGMTVGERLPLGVALLDEARRPLAGVTPDVAWTSSDSAVARIENGEIAAHALGHARLTARTPWDSTATVNIVVGPDLLVVKQHAGAWNIFGRTAAGAWSALTNDSLVESYPTWAPHAMRIAYAVRPAGRPRGGDLWIANADGSDAHRVYGTDSTIVSNPQFVGPSGAEIVFELAFVSNNRSEIWMVGADGRNPHKLPLGPQAARDLVVRAPAVSPDGHRILYQSLRQGSGGYDIYVSNLDGSDERRLTTWQRNDEQPEWAPDGESFFFLRDEGDVQRQMPAAPRPAAGQPVGAPPAQPGELVFTRGGKSASKRIYRYTFADSSTTGVSQAGWYITAFGVGGDGATLYATLLPEQGQLPVLASLNVATGTMIQVPIDVGEIVAQGSPAEPRPAAPAAAPSGAPPAASPRP